MGLLRLATRGSPLALHQTDSVARALRAGHPALDVEVLVVRTQGDDISAPLDQIGGQGVFVTEVEAAVAEGRADAAVHSAKDMTSVMAPGLVLAAATGWWAAGWPTSPRVASWPPAQPVGVRSWPTCVPI
jgi:hydroxymethylbilane synthase